MLIIGLTGSMGSGKSTAVEMLKQEFGDENLALIKFAEPLYTMQEFIYRRISSVYPKPEGFVKDRFLLQFLGSDWARDRISKTLWVDLWEASVNETNKKIIVTDDVRFDNECEKIKSIGGIIIKIEANNSTNRINTANGIQNHQSEKPVDNNLIDYCVQNNGSLEEYKQKLCSLYKQLLNAKR